MRNTESSHVKQINKQAAALLNGKRNHKRETRYTMELNAYFMELDCNPNKMTVGSQ